MTLAQLNGLVHELVQILILTKKMITVNNTYRKTFVSFFGSLDGTLGPWLNHMENDK
jgi:hypothetical protein